MGPGFLVAKEEFSNPEGRGPGWQGATVGVSSSVHHTLSRTRGLQTALALGLLAWGLATLPLAPAWALVGGLGGAVLLVRWPWLAWSALGLALSFAASYAVGPVRGSDLLLAGTLALWFVEGVRQDRLILRPHSVAGWVALYAGVLLLLVPRAVDLREAAAEVVKWTEVLAVVLVLPQALRPRHRPWVMAGLLAGATLQAALGIYQFIGGIGPPHFQVLGRFMRAAGTFRQPNPFAGYLGLTLPVAVSLALDAWSRLPRTARRWRALGLAGALTGVSGVLALGLLASWSRGGWLAGAAGVATVLAFRSRRTLRWGAMGLGLALTAGVLLGLDLAWVPAPVRERLADLPAYLGVGMEEVLRQPLTDANFAIQERLAHWVAALRMWEQAPWLGVGPGNYATVYPSVRLLAWEDPLGHAHNIYLNVLAETGLVGFLAYSAMILGLGGWLARRALQTRGSERALALGVLGVWVHLNLHNLVDNLFVQGIYLHLALWLALVVAPESPSSPPRASLPDGTDMP